MIETSEKLQEKSKTDGVVLEIVQGDENRAKEAVIYDRNGLFYPAYQAAAEVVEQIVARGLQFQKNDSQRRGSERTYDERRYDRRSAMEYEYPNNIIAFAAGRGMGKTSALISFSKALREMGNCSEEQAAGMWKENTRNSGFFVLPPIDPTIMEDRDCIAKVVLSRMFGEFREQSDRYLEQGEDRQIESARNELVDRFRRCYKSVDILKSILKQEEVYDDLLYLSQLGDSSNLKRDVKMLVTRFLEYGRPVTGHERNYLVLQIDDVDLNTRKAYDILEDLRKYFTLPNVIILLSADLVQLRQVIELNFINEYEKAMVYGNASEKRSKYLEMAENYLEKLIPKTHQIHLPEINKRAIERQKHLSVAYYDKDQNDLLEYEYCGLDKNVISDYQEILMRLIWEKTGIIFARKEYLSEILPQKLRGLAQFLEYMCFLKNLECKHVLAGEENRERLLHNLERYEEYLLRWRNDHFSTEQKEISDSLWESTDQDTINVLGNCIAEWKESKLPKKNERTYNADEIEEALEEMAVRGNGGTARFLLSYLSVHKSKMALLVLEKEDSFHDLLTLLGGNYIRTGFVEKANAEYMRFVIDEAKYRQNLQILLNGGETEGKEIYHVVSEKEGDFCFDLLHPLYGYLDNYSLGVKADAKNPEVLEDQKEYESILNSILQIVLNQDVKRRVQDEVSKLPSLFSVKTLAAGAIVREVYSRIDQAAAELSYLPIESHLTKIADRVERQISGYYDMVYLCNDTCAAYYFELLKAHLVDAIPQEQFDMQSPNANARNLEFMGNSAFSKIEQIEPANLEFNDIILQDAHIKKLFDTWNDYAENVNAQFSRIVGAFAEEFEVDSKEKQEGLSGIVEAVEGETEETKKVKETEQEQENSRKRKKTENLEKLMVSYNQTMEEWRREISSMQRG